MQNFSLIRVCLVKFSLFLLWFGLLEFASAEPPHRPPQHTKCGTSILWAENFFDPFFHGFTEVPRKFS